MAAAQRHDAGRATADDPRHGRSSCPTGWRARAARAAEWARLIGAYGVLGETDKRAAALETARKAFAGAPADLAVVEAAAAGPAAPPRADAPTAGSAGAPCVVAPLAAPPAALPGPSAADVQAAGQMSAADRQQMIRGMVQKLADKLANEGGAAPEWARLIGAYGVLGETGRAAAIWTEAQGRFAGHDADLATIRAAAEKAGVVK